MDYKGTYSADYLYGTERADSAWLGGGDDFIFTKGGWDTVYDTAGPAPLWPIGAPEAPPGNDTVWLGNGRDTYFYEEGRDWLDGGKGFDTVYVHKDMEVVREFNNRLILENGDGDQLVMRHVENIQFY